MKVSISKSTTSVLTGNTIFQDIDAKEFFDDVQLKDVNDTYVSMHSFGETYGFALCPKNVTLLNTNDPGQSDLTKWKLETSEDYIIPKKLLDYNRLILDISEPDELFVYSTENPILLLDFNSARTKKNIDTFYQDAWANLNFDQRKKVVEAVQSKTKNQEESFLTKMFGELWLTEQNTKTNVLGEIMLQLTYFLFGLNCNPVDQLIAYVEVAKNFKNNPILKIYRFDQVLKDFLDKNKNAGNMYTQFLQTWVDPNITRKIISELLVFLESYNESAIKFIYNKEMLTTTANDLAKSQQTTSPSTTTKKKKTVFSRFLEDTVYSTSNFAKDKLVFAEAYDAYNMGLDEEKTEFLEFLLSEAKPGNYSIKNKPESEFYHQKLNLYMPRNQIFRQFFELGFYFTMLYTQAAREMFGLKTYQEDQFTESGSIIPHACDGYICATDKFIDTTEVEVVGQFDSGSHIFVCNTQKRSSKKPASNLVLKGYYKNPIPGWEVFFTEMIELKKKQKKQQEYKGLGKRSADAYDEKNKKRKLINFKLRGASSQILCMTCQEPAKFTCSNCKNTFYCGLKCQQTNWNKHKSICSNSNHE